MRKHSKLILASLTATLFMALAVSGTATARTFSISNMNFRTVWTSLAFKNNLGFGEVRCRVTLEGSFHSQTIAKVEKALIGHVTRATVAEANCTGGSATVHQESLPWHITYSGFRGILPAINSIRVLMYGARFQIRIPGSGVCNAISEERNQTRGEIFLDEEGQVENLVPDRLVQVPVTGTLCPSRGFFEAASADGRTQLLGTTTRIMVTLI